MSIHHTTRSNMGACNSSNPGVLPAPVTASDSALIALAKAVKELEAARGEALAAHQAESPSRAEDLERKNAALAEEVQTAREARAEAQRPA